MPAAAVTPAPIAYINVVALKKLVVRLSRVPLTFGTGDAFARRSCPQGAPPGPHPITASRPRFTAGRASYGYVPVSKSECSKQAYALHG